MVSAMEDDVNGENKTNVLEFAGLAPIVRNLYSLKQQETKVNIFMSI